MADINREKNEKKAYKMALKRGTRYRLPGVNYGVVTSVLLLLTVVAVSFAVISSRNGGAPTESDTAESSVLTYEIPKETLTLSHDDLRKGELILVNSDHEFQFPDSREDVSVFENKTSSYKVNDMNVTLSMTAINPFNRLMDDFYSVTGCNDVMVVSGFRTEDFQRELYSERVKTEGAEMAAKYVALPGMSEHHTGLAMDLSVYTDSGEGYYVRDYEKCKWLTENFENYGFVLRYPEEKADITGISYESWHYRYVGLPHSLIMKEKGFCLEEYIEYLQKSDGRVIIYSVDGASEQDASDDIPGDSYAVMYKPSSGEKTEITLPDDREYRVSGDNAGGFIVTILPFGGDMTFVPSDTGESENPETAE